MFLGYFFSSVRLAAEDVENGELLVSITELWLAYTQPVRVKQKWLSEKTEEPVDVK